MNGAVLILWPLATITPQESINHALLQSLLLNVKKNVQMILREHILMTKSKEKNLIQFPELKKFKPK
jgi:hypothetical protein